MSYVLVSLLGDEATASNDEFARWFASSNPPTRAFHAEHPSHDEVALAVREAKNALILGHDGGGSLRGAAKGDAWIKPEQFGHVFQGARVWVWACDTRGATLEADLDSFGRAAFEGGVQVFAGHASPIAAVPTYFGMPALHNLIYQSLDRAFRAFLQGEDRADELRRIALAASVGGRATAFGALPIKKDMDALRVLKR